MVTFDQLMQPLIIALNNLGGSVRIPVKLNSDSGICEPAFFKVVVVFYAARRSFSGLSATILTGVQFLVLPDQRSGCWHRAAS